MYEHALMKPPGSCFIIPQWLLGQETFEDLMNWNQLDHGLWDFEDNELCIFKIKPL